MNSLRTLGLLCCLALLPEAVGQAVPRLDRSSALWFQRGTTNAVSLSGDFLDGATTLLVTGDGVLGEPEAPAPARLTLESSSPGLTAQPAGTTQSLPITLRVDSQAPLGSRELRVAGPAGVSNPLTVHISDIPEFLESSLPKDAGPGGPLALPAAVSGVIAASTETDSIRFAARAGQKLVFDVQANRFGSPLDPTLVLVDASGRELARSEDAHGLDPFLVFSVPADGEYVARIHDLRFQGGGDYRYRMVAGELPYLEFLFPFGGRRGSTVPLRLSGHHLEGAETMTLRVEADAPPGRQEIRARTARGLSNPQPFEAGDLPEFTETEPNATVEQANPVEVPGVVNGTIGEPNDVDHLRFRVPADQKVVIEVQARQFGSPLDALLTLTDAQGTVLQRNDDAGGPDARLEFDAKPGVEYRVSLRDLTDRGGPRFGYRLTLRQPVTTPDFAVRAAGGRFRIAQGGRLAIRCELERRNGFDGVVRIDGENLPAGVSASTLVLGSAPSFGWLILTAQEDAPTGFHPLKLRAQGEVAGRPEPRPVSFGEGAWLTVLPATPVEVEVPQTTLLAEQNGGTGLDVTVLRRAGFDGEVRVAAEDLPGVSIPAVTIPRGQSRARLAIQPAYNAEVGIRPILVRAEAVTQGVTNRTTAAHAVPLQTQGIAMFLTAMLPGSPFFRTDPFRLSAVALPADSASSASSTEFVVKVDRRGLAGEIALALEGLPPGVQATVQPISADKNEAAIRLRVTEATEAGKDYSFHVVGSATHQDRIWRQKTQSITLFVAAPEKETASVPPPPSGTVPNPP